MSPYVGLFFDVVISVALGVIIFYALRLSKQFDRMRADQKVFEALISALNLASARAEASIRAFKETAGSSGDVLQDKITQARGLTDELEIVIQAGDSLADRLQGLAEKSRKAMPDPAPPETKPFAAPAGEMRAASSPETRTTPAGVEPRTRAEKELLEAIRAKQQT